MGSIYLRKYGVATTVDFCLYELDGTDLQTAAASASGDVNLIRDEGPPEQLDADAFTDEGVVYSLNLSLAEMTAARITVYIVDQTNPKAWLDKVLLIETYGHASAQHPFDLATATQSVNVTQVGGAAQSATDLKDFADTGYDPVTHHVLDVEAIVADTNELQTDWHDGGRLDLILDAISGYVDTEVAAIKAVTDTLTLAAIADAVHDEIVEGAITLRKATNIMLAALAGKSSGGGTNSIKFRDQADSKDRISATVDADGNRTAIINDGS